MIKHTDVYICVRNNTEVYLSMCRMGNPWTELSFNKDMLSQETTDTPRNLWIANKRFEFIRMNIMQLYKSHCPTKFSDLVQISKSDTRFDPMTLSIEFWSLWND